MKQLLSIISAILFFNSISAQSSNKSTLTFNPTKGLGAKNMIDLNDVYHDMNDLKYHCFHLVSEQEQSSFCG